MSRRERVFKPVGSSALPLRFEVVPDGTKRLPTAAANAALAPHPRNVVVMVSLPQDGNPALEGLLQRIGEFCLTVPGFTLARVDHTDFASKIPDQRLRAVGSISTWSLMPRPEPSEGAGSKSSDD